MSEHEMMNWIISQSIVIGFMMGWIAASMLARLKGKYGDKFRSIMGLDDLASPEMPFNVIEYDTPEK